MNVKRVLAGVATWSVGLAIPAFYHAMLFHAMATATSYDRISQSYTYSPATFFAPPWVFWLYLIAMTLVGTFLVVSGLKAHHE
jgi:hypothetical protein